MPSIPTINALPIEQYIARRLAVPACEPAAVQGRDWEALAWQAARTAELEAAIVKGISTLCSR